MCRRHESVGLVLPEDRSRRYLRDTPFVDTEHERYQVRAGCLFRERIQQPGCVQFRKNARKNLLRHGADSIRHGCQKPDKTARGQNIALRSRPGARRASLTEYPAHRSGRGADIRRDVAAAGLRIVAIERFDGRIEARTFEAVWGLAHDANTRASSQETDVRSALGNRRQAGDRSAPAAGGAGASPTNRPSPQHDKRAEKGTREGDRHPVGNAAEHDSV